MRHYTVKCALAAMLCGSTLLFTGCNTFEIDADALAEGIEDAWNDMDEAVEERAGEIAKDLESTPNRLEEDADADYSFGSFTLVNPNPLNTVMQAAASALLGGWGDLLVDAANAGRSLATRDFALKNINKDFNNNWVLLFNSLIYLDDDFVYSIETDEIMDNDFEFNAKQMAEILREHGQWNSGYSYGNMAESGTQTAAVESEETNNSAYGSSSVGLGSLPNGNFNYSGNFIYKGKKYPIAISFNNNNGNITNAVYKNLTYDTSIKMTASTGSGMLFSLTGKDNGKPITITINRMDGNNLYGVVNGNGMEMDVELSL